MSLVQLALDILGAGSNTAARQAGNGVGLAWALTGLLRALPFHARQKRLYLPRDLLNRYGVPLGDLFELRPSSNLARTVAAVAQRAEGHLTAARAQQAKVSRAALPALLPGVLARRHLRVLARSAYNPFAASVQARAPGAAWRLAWVHLSGRF